LVIQRVGTLAEQERMTLERGGYKAVGIRWYSVGKCRQTLQVSAGDFDHVTDFSAADLTAFGDSEF
jgi:hypothetical protein